MTDQDALVHIVDIDVDAQGLLTRWLGAAGIESRTYNHLGAFLNADPADAPGCLVIDAQPSAISGLEPRTILLALAMRLPIIMTAHQAGASLARLGVKSGAIAFVDKPLSEREALTTICTAVEASREQRLIVSRREELRRRLETLSPRERQVMALVTTGLLNKQIGADLHLAENTIKAHRRAAMRKMGARSLADLVRMADAIGNEPALFRNGRSTTARIAAVAGHLGFNGSSAR